MRRFIFFILIITLLSCETLENSAPSNPNIDPYDWAVQDGNITGTFNLFPLVKNPSYFNVNEINNVPDDALVAAISINEEVRVYPYQYLGIFEAINDNMQNIDYAITYCPITKSAICYSTIINGENLSLRASGYLLNNNLVLYDEKSDSYWSQMLSTCIKGKYVDQKIKQIHIIETTWKTIKNNFENALVFSDKSVSHTKFGQEKNYQYNFEDGGSYYGILNDRYARAKQIHLYKYDDFQDGLKIYESKIGTENVIIIGNQYFHFITAYIKNDNTSYSILQNEFPLIMKDNKSNVYNIFGLAISGPKKGQQLASPPTFVALGWAWKMFYFDFVIDN